jgi:hypothetical protein
MAKHEASHTRPEDRLVTLVRMRSLDGAIRPSVTRDGTPPGSRGEGAVEDFHEARW